MSSAAPDIRHYGTRPDGTTMLVAFTRALAAAGLPVGPERTGRFLQGAAALGVDRGRDVYWAGRATLTSDPDHLPVYDAVFAAYFSDLADLPAARRTPAVPNKVLVPLADLPSGAEQDEQIPPSVKAGAAATEVLRHRDLAGLTDAERRELAQLLRLLEPGLPRRPSRRRGPHHRGPIDPRRTVRAMLANGGEPGVPARHHRRTRPRRIVLLIDVSGSMTAYADSLLRFAHAVHRSQPGAVETFTLGTRLTRISGGLAHRDPERALTAAASAIPDYSGGTRLGDTLKAFLDRWGRRGIARGAVVVLFSDGWERGSPEQLAEQISRLHRLARSLIWVNPHKGKDGYAPVQGGIVAVLPHLDHFVAGHSLAALEDLLEVVRRA